MGATRGAYEPWRQASRTRFTALTREQVAMFSHSQIRLAQIEAQIQTARLFLQDVLDGVKSDHPLLSETFRENGKSRGGHAYGYEEPSNPTGSVPRNHGSLRQSCHSLATST